jgi:hypothetical protein
MQAAISPLDPREQQRAGPRFFQHNSVAGNGCACSVVVPCDLRVQGRGQEAKCKKASAHGT